MRNIIRCGLWIIFGLNMSLGWAETSDYMGLTALGFYLEQIFKGICCLSAGTGQPNSQANCQTCDGTSSTLRLQCNLSPCGPNNQGYSNAGIKITTEGVAAAYEALNFNPATGYNTFQLDSNAATEIHIYQAKPASGSASGGTFVTIRGDNLGGVTSATVGGALATNFSVVNGTTVTFVTPASPAGPVDVQLKSSGAFGPKTLTLPDIFTNKPTEVGQSAYGGTIACLGDGLNNLIAAKTDNSDGIQWGGYGTQTGAQSDTDGAANTTTIVNALVSETNNYAAKLCDTYQIDSQGNTPCQSGNTCYNDWFLPAKNQLNCLYTNKIAIGGFADGLYWSSTESSDFPEGDAWFQDFSNGVQFDGTKNFGNLRVRCVRAFTP